MKPIDADRNREIEWSDLGGPVREWLSTLQRFHPRYTYERIVALQSVRTLSMSGLERFAVTSFAADILGGTAREPGQDIDRRAYLFVAPAAVVLGAVAVSVLFSMGPSPGSTMGLIAGFALLFALSGAFFELALVPFGAAYLQAGSRRANNRVRVEAAIMLGKLPCRTGLLALATACRDRNDRIRHAAAEALPSLLPVMLEAQMAPLRSDESDALARSLPEIDRRFVPTALQVLEQKGSTSALAPLRQYAAHVPAVELRDLVERAISRLEERLAVERQRETLLRPAAPDTSLLLQPAESAGERDVALLLRPAVEE